MPRSLSVAEIERFRARLCAVAQQRFAAQGPDAVSMRQLADALGCSPMTPYRYFRDKDEILAAVRAAAFDRFAAAMEQTAKATRGARAKSQALGDAYVRFALREPAAYRLMFDLSQPNQDRYPDLVRASTRARRTMSACFEALVAARVLAGDPQVLGHVFWATMHGLILLHFAGKLPDKPGFPTLQLEARRLLVQGARAPASASRRRLAITRRASSP